MKLAGKNNINIALVRPVLLLGILISAVGNKIDIAVKRFRFFLFFLFFFHINTSNKINAHVLRRNTLFVTDRKEKTGRYFHICLFFTTHRIR